MCFARWLDPLGAAGLAGGDAVRCPACGRPRRLLEGGGCAAEGGKRDGFGALCFKNNLFQIT